MRMLVKAIPILHRYLSRLKIIDIHILQQQVSLSIYSLCAYVHLCLYVYRLVTLKNAWHYRANGLLSESD